MTGFDLAPGREQLDRTVDDIPPSKADRTQLQQIVAGLNDGVILIDQEPPLG